MMRIDAVTARDLDLDRVRESLDRTRSRAGSEAQGPRPGTSAWAGRRGW